MKNNLYVSNLNIMIFLPIKKMDVPTKYDYEKHKIEKLFTNKYMEQ